MDLSAYPYKVLETKDDFKFDCGDADLNEFFLKDAIPHKRELIGVTYLHWKIKPAAGFLRLTRTTRILYCNFTKNQVSFFIPIKIKTKARVP